MVELYTCHGSPDGYVMKKFDQDYECLSTYTLTKSECDCPRGNKSHCRHREMLPHFLKYKHLGDGWFLDRHTLQWRQPVRDVPIIETMDSGPVDDLAETLQASAEPEPAPQNAPVETASVMTNGSGESHSSKPQPHSAPPVGASSPKPSWRRI